MCIILPLIRFFLSFTSLLLLFIVLLFPILLFGRSFMCVTLFLNSNVHYARLHSLCRPIHSLAHIKSTFCHINAHTIELRIVWWNLGWNGAKMTATSHQMRAIVESAFSDSIAKKSHKTISTQHISKFVQSHGIILSRTYSCACVLYF